MSKYGWTISNVLREIPNWHIPAFMEWLDNDTEQTAHRAWQEGYDAAERDTILGLSIATTNPYCPEEG